MHLLRELRGIFEQTKQEWAQEMVDFLLQAKQQKETKHLDAQELVKLHQKYETIVAKGEASNPTKPKEGNVRGRQKQSLARNLLNRLIANQESILAFLLHPVIPFDNNQAERDIRPVKLRQKISGSFRRQQIAKNLVEHLTHWLNQESISSIQMYVDLDNKLALNFWENTGFEKEFFLLSNS
ncbi:GNAT family N-acetyltransferase [Bacillus sp. JJ864]